MSLDEPHPLFSANLGRWTLCRDAHQGQDVVRAKREAYLPPTRGMVLDGMGEGQQGLLRYNAYLNRALFPEVFADTINILVGIMNRKPPAITLPEQMQPLLEKATILGEGLNDVIRKIHEQQLITARVGVHLDVPSEPVRQANMLPLLSIFNAEAIRNWDDGEVLDPTRQTLNLVVIDASEYTRDGFSWTYNKKYRVLALGDLEANEAQGTAVYTNGLFDESEGFDESRMEAPLLRDKPLTEIPFVFIGPKDINVEPDLPPMLGLANRSFAIYNGEADLRQALHITAEETLVTIGTPLTEDSALRVGTGARIAMSEGGDVKYVGPDSRAIAFQESNVKRDYETANALSARLSNQGSQVESGEALRIRVAAQTSNIASIARSAAVGMQEILRVAARWLDLNPDEVTVEPNLNFADDPIEFTELNEMMTFKQRGGVISHKTMNEVMVSRDITTRTLEEEVAQVEEEENIIPDSIADLSAMSSMGAAGAPFEEAEPPGGRAGAESEPDELDEQDDE